MKIKVLTHASNQNEPGFQRWRQSMEHFKYDFTVLFDENFGWAKVYDTLYKWCISDEAKEYTHILYTDSYDVVVVAGMSEVLEKYKDHTKAVFSTEKQCFPNIGQEKYFTEIQGEWKYINAGGSLFPIDVFIDFFVYCPMGTTNVQEWCINNYGVNNQNGLLTLDNNCQIFQTIAFAYDKELIQIEDRLLNTVTGSLPIFLHGNGRTDMTLPNNILNTILQNK